MSIGLEQRISAWAALGKELGETRTELDSAIERACFENPWFTREHCKSAIDHWARMLDEQSLRTFVKQYAIRDGDCPIGIVMAGNVPLVGLHDLLCVSLCGHRAIAKTSSDDNVLMKYLVERLRHIDPAVGKQIAFTEQLPGDISAVIATGSNNTYRYFEHYFRGIPHILRKNRKSIAVLDGDETDAQLDRLAEDVFSYFGLGCRNVSLLFIPRGMDRTRILDHFMAYAHLADHHRYANNYTYHKALYLMNQQAHLDTGFILFREERQIQVPLGCVYYSMYDDPSEVDAFVAEHAAEIQCIVGKNYKQSDVEYGRAQHPELQDFADKVDSMEFLVGHECDRESRLNG